MSDTLRTYLAIEVEHEGVLRTFGSLTVPLIANGLTITGDAFDKADVLEIPATTTVEVYNWFGVGGKTGGATPADFEAFVLAIVSEDDDDAETDAYLEVYEIIDIPTSTTDLRPAGTGQHSRQLEMSNTVPYCCGSDQRKTQATATDFTKIGSLTSYSASTGTGTPDLIGSATRVNGKVYSIKVYNPGANPVRIKRLRVN